MGLQQCVTLLGFPYISFQANLVADVWIWSYYKESGTKLSEQGRRK